MARPGPGVHRPAPQKVILSALLHRPCGIVRTQLQRFCGPRLRSTWPMSLSLQTPCRWSKGSEGGLGGHGCSRLERRRSGTGGGPRFISKGAREAKSLSAGGAAAGGSLAGVVGKPPDSFTDTPCWMRGSSRLLGARGAGAQIEGRLCPGVRVHGEGTEVRRQCQKCQRTPETVAKGGGPGDLEATENKTAGEALNVLASGEALDTPEADASHGSAAPAGTSACLPSSSGTSLSHSSAPAVGCSSAECSKGGAHIFRVVAPRRWGAAHKPSKALPWDRCTVDADDERGQGGGSGACGAG